MFTMPGSTVIYAMIFFKEHLCKNEASKIETIYFLAFGEYANALGANP